MHMCAYVCVCGGGEVGEREGGWVGVCVKVYVYVCVCFVAGFK